MDDRRVGRALRALRLRRGLRQADVGRRAGISRSSVSLIEAGNVGSVSTATIRAVAAALGADVTFDLRWHGADLDRLIDQRHADLVARTIERLSDLGWTTRPEVSYSVFGERGSIDVLAWHAATRMLLVVEAKTALGSLEETLRRHDAKARLAPRIAKEGFGWPANRAARLLVFPSRATPRRHVARAEGVLATAYPVRGAELRRWLADPARPVAGLLFLSDSSGVGASAPARSGRRVRAPGRSAGQPRSAHMPTSSADEPCTVRAGPGRSSRANPTGM